jgi:EmrB/QacA subfamily drug resistance transporter
VSDATPGSAPQLDRRGRLTVLAICSMSLLVVGLDTTIVNVALPAIHRSFSSSLAGLQWVIDAYTLALATLLMLAGSTADRTGRKRVFAFGLALFTAASALCAAAPDLDILIAARILQGVGGSMLNPVAMSIIRNVFEDPRERAQAIGLWGSLFGLSMALGPVLGGALVDSVGWRFVFLVNVPVGLAGVALIRRFVPESRADHARRIDPVGQLLVIATLAALVYAIIEGQSRGWASGEILGLFAFSLVAFAALVRYELHRTEPLLELRFFRSAPFAGASAIAICTFAGLGGFLFMNTLYLQDARHLSAFHAGLATLPLAGVLLVAAPVCGRYMANRGARRPLLLAGAVLTISPLLLTGLSVHTSDAVLLVAYLLFGLGSGAVNPPITNTAISGMPPAQAGVAAAIASTCRQVGMTLGIAVVGAVIGAGSGRSLGRGFASATHPGWWIIAGLGLAILMLGALTTSAWAYSTARTTATRLAPGGAGVL